MGEMCDLEFIWNDLARKEDYTTDSEEYSYFSSLGPTNQT